MGEIAEYEEEFVLQRDQEWLVDPEKTAGACVSVGVGLVGLFTRLG